MNELSRVQKQQGEGNLLCCGPKLVLAQDNTTDANSAN